MTQRLLTENSKQRLSLQYSITAHNKLSDEGSRERQYDFSITKKQIRKCYPNIPRIALSVDEVVYIFRYFIETHDIFCRDDHPHIKKETLIELLGKIDYCDDSIDLTVECYRNMIDYYFTVEFEI